jgi:glucosamine--fructose-6-phosphate aminotransferase (isomerizing)
LCGIIGVTARRGNVVPLILEGLERLEYRGYDSVGIAVQMLDGKIVVRKGAGKLADVRRRLLLDQLEGSTAIGHTRWATHGAPNDVNAHPHTDCSGKIVLVHNGVIRNYASLREALLGRHVIRSETDTELIAHLLEEEARTSNGMLEALASTLEKLEGSYALAIISSAEPGRIYFARMRSPLVIGVGDGVNALASDIPALLHITRRIVTLEDGEFGWISPDEIRMYRLTPQSGYVQVPLDEVRRRIKRVEWSVERASKGGYPHFMIKEIYEQPQALLDTFNGVAEAPEISKAASILAGSRNVFVVGAGTSYHAGLVFAYYLARLARVASMPLIASEFKIFRDAVNEEDVVVAISQSGETYDTLEAVRAYKARGAYVVGVTNIVGSALDRESNLSIYIRAGPEIGVAATKTFTSQVLALQALAIRTAQTQGFITSGEARELLSELSRAPNLIAEAIKASEPIARFLAERKSESWRSMYILGRGLGYPIAREGALKVKEIAYLHAEAYPAGESKHGPIALVEEGFPVFLVATSDSPEIAGNALEMAARGADVMVLKPSGMNMEVPERPNIKVLSMPAISPLLEPYSLTPFFQLLAYYIAVKKGYDPDKPRNLAKTVTVE